MNKSMLTIPCFFPTFKMWIEMFVHEVPEVAKGVDVGKSRKCKVREKMFYQYKSRRCTM